MKLSDVKPGMTLVADGGFIHLEQGEHVVVNRDDYGILYVPVPGPFVRHYLENVDIEGNLVGFTLASDPDPISGAL